MHINHVQRDLSQINPWLRGSPFLVPGESPTRLPRSEGTDHLLLDSTAVHLLQQVRVDY